MLGGATYKNWKSGPEVLWTSDLEVLVILNDVCFGESVIA